MNVRVQCSRRRRSAAAGFTLVETLIGLTVGMLVLAAIASILVMSARLAYKNKEIDSAAGSTRLVQEHINSELSIAISQIKPYVIRPEFSDPSTTTPTRYATMAYRVAVGSFASVAANADKTSSTILLDCPADMKPEAGDYLMLDTPNLGTGIQIDAVEDNRLEGSSGTVTLTLSKALADGTIGTAEDAVAGKLATIQRQRKYVVPAAASGSAVTELDWYANAATDSHIVLSKNVDANARFMFAQVPEDTSATDLAPESSVSWQFSYVSENSSVGLPGGHPDYYQTNYAEGLIMPKSGNPLNSSSIVGSGSTTSTTTSTTTSSTTTSSTTTSSTTSTTTSTTSSTTTSTTSTSTKSTTSTTTSKTTTSKTTSTSTTSKSTTSTTSTSTTSKSTTSKSTTSTTSKSTTSTTSSKTTSTSTSATTSKSTTSTSSASTTSTTSSKTTTSTTTATTTSSTTSKTTTSTSTTTSKSTTTTIPFDG